MDFTTAVRTVLKERFADFQGRARRSEFWWFYLFVMIVFIALYAVVMALAFSGSGLLAAIGGIAFLVVVLGLFIPYLAVAVRRMHDTGRSGWFLLIGMIPLVGLIVLFWFVQRGTVGPNEFGEDPYDAAGAVPAE